MRFWCLTRFFINFDELSQLRDDIRIQYLEKYSELQKYALTEINIFKRGIMIFKLLRDDVGGLVFSMKPGWMEAVKIEDNVVDINIIKVTADPSTFINHDEELFIEPQIFLEIFVSKFRIRCIKYTSNRILTNDEKIIYKAYEKEIENYAQNNPERREAAFAEVPKLNLREKTGKATKNNGNRNREREKYADLIFIVNALCDSQNGSIENLQNNPRYSYKNAFPDDETPFIMTGKRNAKLNRSTQSFHLIPFIQADNVHMNSINPNWFHPHLEILSLKNVNPFACPEKEWKVFADGIQDCKKLEQLVLQACNIKAIPSVVFEVLPPSIKILNLKSNSIESISAHISRLIHLRDLILSNNENLTDKSFPWKHLPKSLLLLKLKNTGISFIPPEIKHLSLQQLTISGKFLKTISWDHLNCTRLFEMKIMGNVKINEATLANASKLQTLKIQHSDLSDCMWYRLPENIKNFNLCNNKISTVDCEAIMEKMKFLLLAENHISIVNWQSLSRNLPKIESINLRNNKLAEALLGNSTFIYLTKLDLSNNEISKISCESFPHSLQELDLSHNKLTEIDSLNQLTSLKFLKLNNNKLQQLPNNFLSDVIVLQTFEMFRIKNDDDCSGWLSSHFDYISLAHNQLTGLPSGFETLNVTTFNIAYNAIDLKTLEEARNFWKHLPRKITELRLSGNALYELPCELSKKSIMDLEARDCNLKYICPQLRKIYLIDICLNDKMEYLSFVPKKIYYPPLANVLPSRNVTLDVITTNKSYRNTVKWLTQKNVHQYNFEKVESTVEEKNRLCHCCARCGNNCSGEYIIQTLMVSDYGIAMVEKNEHVSEYLREYNEKFIEFRQFHMFFGRTPFITLNSNINYQCWGSKGWKTEVRTEMCDNCITNMKADIEQFYANADNLKHFNEEEPKRKKNTKLRSNIREESDSNTNFQNPSIEMSLQDVVSGIDYILSSVVKIIDLMSFLKSSIISNSSPANTTLHELTKILKEEETGFEKLRETIVDLEEDILTALLKVLFLIDENSKNLLQFTYNCVQECQCGVFTVTNVEKCMILQLKVGQHLNTRLTFNDMLNAWEQIDMGACVTCNFNKRNKYTISYGNDQHYLIVEIDASLNTSKQFVSSDNFNCNSQLIYGKLWKLIGAVQYNCSITQGRYIIWKKYGENWITIDDNKQLIKKEMDKHLNNYKILIFERMNVSFIDPEIYLTNFDHQSSSRADPT